VKERARRGEREKGKIESEIERGKQTIDVETQRGYK